MTFDPARLAFELGARVKLGSCERLIMEPSNIPNTTSSSPTWPTLENKPKRPAYTGWDSFCSAVLLSMLAFATVAMWALWLYSFLVKPTSPAQSIVTVLQFWGAAMLTAASATVSYLDSEYRWKRGVR